MKDIILLYRGYYHSTLLAVSTNKSILKYYLKETRHLNSDDYHIEKSNMDSDNIYALYDDYILEEFSKDLYLPVRDCRILEREVESYFSNCVNTLNQLREYLRSIQGIDILSKHALQIQDTIHNMEDDLTNSKVLKKMRKRVIKTSKVLSTDIQTYCKLMNIKNEELQMDNMYLYKLYDDKS